MCSKKVPVDKLHLNKTINLRKSPYSVRIQEKSGKEIIPYLDNFHAVPRTQESILH